MSGFNFGQIGSIISNYMDTDLIDIKRNISGQLQTVYINVPCHVTFASSDNPDPITVATKPIIMSLMIHMDIDYDVRNDDYIVIKKVSNNNINLHTYSGRCGEPVFDQCRQKILVAMTADEPATPEPLPPSNPCTVTISYISENEEILQAPTIYMMEMGETELFYPQTITGYVADSAYLNDVKQDSLIVTIVNATLVEYEIKYVYKVSAVATYMRFLLNGLYTKDNGSLANGYYLYRKIPLEVIEDSESTYKVRISNEPIVQEDTGEVIKVVRGLKVALYVGQIYMIVNEVENLLDTDILTLIPYTPTDDEKNAYLTEWYD